MNAATSMTPLHLNRLGKGIAGFVFSALLAMSATAQIASGTTGIDATGNARSEMMACLNGTTQQSRETCMTEVRNANAAKRAGQVDNAGGQFRANALMRCDVFAGEDKSACEARIAGYGSTQGSVAGGGVIREVETVVAPNTGGTVIVQPKTRSDAIIVLPGTR